MIDGVCWSIAGGVEDGRGIARDRVSMIKSPANFGIEFHPPLEKAFCFHQS